MPCISAAPLSHLGLLGHVSTAALPRLAASAWDRCPCLAAAARALVEATAYALVALLARLALFAPSSTVALLIQTLASLVSIVVAPHSYVRDRFIPKSSALGSYPLRSKVVQGARSQLLGRE